MRNTTFLFSNICCRQPWLTLFFWVWCFLQSLCVKKLCCDVECLCVAKSKNQELWEILQIAQNVKSPKMKKKKKQRNFDNWCNGNSNFYLSATIILLCALRVCTSVWHPHLSSAIHKFWFDFLFWNILNDDFSFHHDVANHIHQYFPKQISILTIGWKMVIGCYLRNNSMFLRWFPAEIEF